MIPQLPKNEYFDAVFVFAGEKAPSMSVVSLSKDVAIRANQEWKELIKLFFQGALIGLVVLTIPIFLIGSFIDYFSGPGTHSKSVERFVQHADELQKNGELKSVNQEVIAGARTIYASFIRPKPNKVWSKLFGEQRFDY